MTTHQFTQVQEKPKQANTYIQATQGNRAAQLHNYKRVEANDIKTQYILEEKSSTS